MTNQLSSPFRSAADHFRRKSKIDEWRKNPSLWTKERLNIDLWSKQTEIGDSLVVNKKTAVKSCHDSGKTFSAAIFVCWWLDVYADEDCLVVTTAPTNHQVQKIMWEYVRKMHMKYGLRGTVSENAEWKDDGRNVIGFGRKPADTNDHGFQGQHHKYTLVIIDEGCGVKASLFTGVEAITTTDTCRILTIGNPDDIATEFGRIFKSDPTWNKITISAFDTPNFTGEEVSEEVSSTLLSKAWVEEKRLSWGEGSMRWKSKVLAQFPEGSIDTFFSPSLLDSTLDNVVTVGSYDRGIMGLDVARFGNDLSVLALNRGGQVSIVGVWDNLRTTDLAAAVHRCVLDNKVDEIRVDATGIGSGVVDALVDLAGESYRVIGMYGSGSTSDIDKWVNARAEWHDQLRTKMISGLVEFRMEVDVSTKVREEFEGIRYKFSSRRQSVQIESKDEMRRRGIKSPDYADAIIYACADLPNENEPEKGDVITVAASDMLDDVYQLLGYSISPF